MEMQRVLGIIWRVLKVLPVFGYMVVLAGAPDVLRRKGYVMGSLSVALDIIPVICLIKAGIEIFSGDMIPDRNSLIEVELESSQSPSFELAA